MKKRALSVILVLCMVCTLLPVSAFAADIVDSGYCGNDVTWKLDNKGVLTISGIGDMLDFNRAPWFDERETIKAAIIEDGVTSIGNLSFQNCSNMINVSIPDSVVSVGECAFWMCNSIPNIIIPEKVNNIGRAAFLGCSSLTSVTIPSGIASIEESTFNQCSSLTEIVIPNGVISIGDSAFSNCTSLAKIVIPSSVTRIGSRAFTLLNEDLITHYGGSYKQWQSIVFGQNNNDLLNSPLHLTIERVTKPTCTENGYTTHICIECDYSYVDTSTKPLDHDFSEWDVSTTPTCTAKGVETRRCSRCDATETREIALLDHNYSYYVSASPTENDFGVLTGACECGAEVSITLPKLNETDYTYVVTEAVTCISEGSATYTLNNTQYGVYSFDVTLPKGSGDHKCTSVVVAPTCTEQGYSYYKCEYCERIIGDYTDYLPALGHDYVDGVCTRCGDREQIVKENPFADLSEGAVYYDAILWAYYHTPQQITGGFTATEFRPQNPCTRAQVVTFLWRAAGCPEPTGDTSIFKDASSIASPFRKAVAWAVEKGITAGYNDGTFRPNDPVTRAQFVTFLWRYENKPDTTGSIAGFADASSIAAPYQQAVAWAVEKGITTGYNDGTFRPNAACTRWAVVLFMYRDLA